MAKKVKLTELTAKDKAKLRSTMLYTLSITTLVCAILVSCFACAQQTPTPQPSQEQNAEKQRLYWTSILVDTQWEPQTNERNDGKLEGFKAALRANIIYDPNANGLVIRFGSSQPFFKQGHVELSNSEGSIAFDDGKTWSVRFSEKNEVRYMTIVDSQGKTVYYTCL